MSQYTNSYTTSAGSVVNTILDTVTNTQATTVVTASGKTATVTYPIGGASPAIARSLVEQLGVADPGIPLGLSRTSNDVLGQQASATEEALTTGNPPPAESQAIPVPAADNPNPTPNPDVVVTPVRDPYPLNLATTEVAPTVEAKQDPSSSEYTNESDRASDAASQQIANQQDPSSSEYTNESDRASDAASQQIANQQDPSSAEYINESDRASDLASQTIQNQKTPAENTPTGPAYDDAGYLMPGWSLNENNEPVWVGDNADGTIFVEPATKLSADTSRNSYTALLKDTQSKATQADANNLQQERDWRVKLSLAKGGKYLYNVDGDAGILGPLKATNGIIFPYTPQINVTYAANYDPTELIHSNYKIFQYKGSSVDQISITCDFTAQDTFEANYLLAVIHFFRSVTKMFYGQDQKPNIGSPPPLCYLSGLGAFQFNNHPLAIASFNYSLPNDVDYIRATNTTTIPGVNKSAEKVPNNSESVQQARIGGAKGLAEKQPAFQQPPAGSVEPTYVPTKMSIQITAYPIVSRNDISNRFSLRDYATGNLLRGKQDTTGGIW